LGWVGLGQLVKQTSLLIIFVILARILDPSDFGLVGMILVFTGFAKLIGDLGLGAGLIQKTHLKESHLNTIFTANIITGIFLCVLFWTCAGAISKFYSEPRLTLLIKVISFSFIIESTKVIQKSLLERQMNFKKLIIIEIISEIFSGVLVIILALSGWGVWSLIAQHLFPAFISAIFLWIFSSWRPTKLFDLSAYNDLKKFSLNLLGFNVFNYATRNVDNLLVGKYLGSTALGIYIWGYRIMLFPIYQMSGIITRVMFPVFSTIQDDKDRIKNIYFRATRLIALITFPTMIGIYVLAKPFVLVVLGEKWAAVIPILKILCIAGIRQSVGTTVSWIYTSQGRTDLQLKWNGIVSSIISIVAFAIGLQWGIIGVATAYVLSGYLILWYPTWQIPLRLINISFFEMLHNLSSIFFTAVLMGLSVWIIQFLLPEHYMPWKRLVISTIFGGLVYWRMVIFFKLKAYADLLYFIKGNGNG